MASIEYIQKRITGKEKELEKLNKKLERIKEAQSANWEKNPYYYHESDLKWCLRDIEKAETALAQYRADLEIATEKANSRNVEVILQFLARWKAENMEWYQEQFVKFLKELEKGIRKITITANGSTTVVGGRSAKKKPKKLKKGKGS